MTTEFNDTAFIAVNPQLLENLANIIKNRFTSKYPNLCELV